jgi:colanic acid biosynthesis glycosyl transferase WcaI
MGDPYVGIIHPCKIYNILAVNRSILYIGPDKSHVSEVIRNVTVRAYSCRTGDADAVESSILRAFAQPIVNAGIPLDYAKRFSKERLLPQLISAIERDPNTANASIGGVSFKNQAQI